MKRLLLGLLFVVVAVAASAWVLGSKLIQPVNHAVPLPAGFQAQIVSIQGGGHRIAGWWVDQDGESPVVLLLHAVRGDRSTMISRAQLLMRHGFSVLLIDLQGHGETPGEAITLGLRESSDVAAARDWIRHTAPGRRIGVIGCSLGGASTLLAAQPSGFDAVVLEAVYPRISRAVENRIRIRLGPLAPLLTPLMLMQFQPRLHIAASDLEPIRSIARLGAPVLVVAGSSDEHTTLAESRELYDAAAAPKSLWIVEGAHHQDLLAYDPIGYEEHVVGFLAKALDATRAAEIYANFPDSIHANERYVIYSHGFIVEGNDPKPISPKYGQYDFPAIKQALFIGGGFNLIAYQRPKNADSQGYVETLKSWVKRLLDAGVSPSRITLVGFSRGGQMTAFAAGDLAAAGINTALLAICNDGDLERDPPLVLGGNLLSIYEKSDELGSCAKLAARSHLASFKEVAISTGKSHGAFFQPLPDWLQPLKMWIQETNR